MKGAAGGDGRGGQSDPKRALLELLLKNAGLPGRGKPAHGPPATAGSSAASGEPFPLSDLQQSYWVGQTGFYGNVAVVPCGYIEFDAPVLDLARLERSWQRLIERHEMLRAVISPSGEQRILREVPAYRIEETDLRGLSTADCEAALASVRSQMESSAPRDQWPLFSLTASRLPDRYRIHMNMSTLIVDGLSMDVLFEEWYLLYRDPGAALPPLGYTFRQYMYALESQRGTEKYRRAEAYWQERLATLPPPPELPLRPFRSASAGAATSLHRRSAALTAEPWQRIKRRGARAGLSPNTVLLTTYADLLATWSRSPRFSINVMTFNRPPLSPDIHRVVGNFGAPLVLEIDAQREVSFITRAQRIQEQLLRDLEHSEYSGIQVMRELNRRQGDAARAAVPVVYASFIGANRQLEQRSILGSILIPTYSSIRTPQIWLDHQLYESSSTLFFDWDSKDSIFCPGVAEELFQAWQCQLGSLSSDESAWSGLRRELAPPAQLAARAQINMTDAPVSDALLHELFTAQVRRTPDAPAIISNERTLSYQELDSLTSSLAAAIGELGPEPNTLIAVVMDKGWEQIVAALAILKAGAAFLPVDPALPQERLRYVIEHAQARLAITQPRHDQAVTWPNGPRLLHVDSTARTPVLQRPKCQPNDLAYVIFTSGSTGLPKGVMIEHRAAVNTCLDINGLLGLGPRDRVLALSALSFDLSIYDIFGTLNAGGAIVLPDAAALRDPAHWVALMQSAKVTLWNSVPALMEMLVEHLSALKAQLPPTLRHIMLSGDWIPVSLPARMRALGSDLNIISLGGATEAAIWSIYYPIGQVEPDWPSIPYGRPLKNQRMHVLDQALKPCPVWVPGDLYIGGLGLARGYWRDEERTRAAFIVYPPTGEVLYRTGDLGRYLPSGDIEFLGREDSQVKVQGYRIELGEIEVTLTRHPEVRAAAAAVFSEHGIKRLAAFAVCKEHSNTTSAELLALLAERLPAYMVPSVCVLLDKIPLTENGKVDRRALVRLVERGTGTALAEGPRARAASSVLPPRNATEAQLVELWEKLLGVQPIGITDDFLAVGGHSLTAVRLLVQIEERFGRRLPASALFQGGTVERIASMLQSAPAPASSVLVPMNQGHGRAPLYCMHPIGGGIACYAELSQQLGPEQPFFALQAPGYDDNLAPLTRVEELAALYIDSIRGQQPAGPYLLAGWSFGAAVAFETAYQLTARGETVALLALLDPYPLASRPDYVDLDGAALFPLFLRDLLTQQRALGARVKGDLAAIQREAGLDQMMTRAYAEGYLPSELDRSRIKQLLAVLKANRTALREYQPPMLAIPLQIFRAAESIPITAGHPDGGWAAFSTSSAALHIIQGDHYSMLGRSHVHELGQLLQASLKAARATAASPAIKPRGTS